MTLPSSGEISFDDINVELGNSIGDECNIRSMASAFSLSTPDGMNEFYGLTFGSNVIYDYSDSTSNYSTTTSTNIDQYKSLVISGRQSGQVYTLNFNVSFVKDSEICTAEVYKNINGSGWSTIWGPYTSGSSGSISISGIDYDDTVQLRLRLTGFRTTPNASLTLSLNGGSVTTGTGTVTSSGTTSWTVLLGSPI